MQEWEYTRIGTWRINAVHANGEFGHVSSLRNSRALDTSPTTRQASLPAVHGGFDDPNLVQPVGWQQIKIWCRQGCLQRSHSGLREAGLSGGTWSFLMPSKSKLLTSGCAGLCYIEPMKHASSLAGMMIVVAAAGGCAQSVSVNFGNPSEANCKKQGGVLRTEKGADADRNTCVLPDGSAFEEWVQHARQPPAK